MTIPNARPYITDEELLEIKKVFTSGWLGMGSVVLEFENALKAYLGAKYVIAVNTGTSALHIALDALGIKEGDEVIVPSLTFIGTIQAIINCNAKPVFCEIEADTLNIDIEDAVKRITAKTRAIMPIHYGGQPVDMQRLMDISQKYSLRIVEDAAHAFGSVYGQKKIGSFGDVTCFSFDPIKTITCGEGGAVVVQDEALAQILIRKRILGIDKDTWQRYKNQRSWFYEVVTRGYRYHMSNINAAIGLVQLKKIDKFIEKRTSLCRLYDKSFSNMEGIEVLKRDYGRIAPFNYIIKVSKDRDGLLNYLKENGIDAGIHYIPNHMQPLFKDSRISLPVTENIYKQILTLPLYFELEESDVLKIVKSIIRFYAD